VIDAGPVIGAVDVRDEHHSVSAQGFRQLYDARAELLIPVPIVFAVYKRLAYQVNVEIARRSLDLMRDAFEYQCVGRDELTDLEELIESMPWWGGSLEDATLAMVGLRGDVPVWTFNYRDLRAFPNLQFWTPG
jgi:hypothetical protein